MRRFALAGAFVLAASTSYAQTETQPLAPEGEQSEAGARSGPANLCQELLAFLQAPPEQEAAAAPPSSADDPSSDEEEGAQSDASDGDEEAAQSDTGSASSQEVTGQEGVASDAPEEDGGDQAAGSVTNAPQRESRSAPLPPDDTSSTPSQSVITVDEVEALAEANDIAGCQQAARQMRVSGVSMPPPLMALAALDLKFHQDGGTATSPTGVNDTGTSEDPASGQDPASSTQTPQ